MQKEGGKTYTVHNKKLLYPDLSFQINGVLFDVAKTLGGGHKEKYYQKAIAIGLEKKKIAFKEQVYIPLFYQKERVGTYYLDFLVEDCIVLEIKRGNQISRSVIDQTKQYLSACHIKLGLVAYFTFNGVSITRVINEY